MLIGLLFILIFIVGIRIPYWIQNHRIKKWQQSLHLNEHFAVFQTLYQNTDGFALSKQARMSQDAMEYTYGEIDFMSFIALISLTHPTKQTRFYDLGSGTGKAVLASAMVFEMQQCCGVELFETLHSAACQQQMALQKREEYGKKGSAILLIHANFLNVPLNDATLIFINATALFGETWEKLNFKICREVKPGTLIITTSKPLINLKTFTLIQTTRVKMSWGMVNSYVHRTV